VVIVTSLFIIKKIYKGTGGFKVQTLFPSLAVLLDEQLALII